HLDGHSAFDGGRFRDSGPRSGGEHGRQRRGAAVGLAGQLPPVFRARFERHASLRRRTRALRGEPVMAPPGTRRIWWLVVGLAGTLGCDGGLHGPLIDAVRVFDRPWKTDGGDGAGRDLGDDLETNDAPLGTDDAVTSDASTIDAGTDASRPVVCDVAQPFGRPYLLGGTQGDEWGARFTPDELTMYSFLTPGNVPDLFVWTRPHRVSRLG